MVYTVNLHFCDSEYQSEQISVTAQNIEEALLIVEEMIQKKDAAVVAREEGYFGAGYVYYAAVNMGMVIKFEIRKS